MRKRCVAADSAAAHADELFRSRLGNPIDLRHPLAKLGQRMPCTGLEDALAPTLPPDPERGGRTELPGQPIRRRTLAEQLEQAEIVSGQKPTTAIVDLGYRGREIDGVTILHRG